jgi:hypothetical protein
MKRWKSPSITGWDDFQNPRPPTDSAEGAHFKVPGLRFQRSWYNLPKCWSYNVLELFVQTWVVGVALGLLCRLAGGTVNGFRNRSPPR